MHIRNSIPVAIIIALGAVGSRAVSIVDLPVSFSVELKNTSPIVGSACPASASGPVVSVKGHLVAPMGALQKSKRAVTLYVHGASVNESLFYFDAVPGYNYARNMAKLGHTSVTINRIGFGNSHIPSNGYDTCLGIDASVHAQIVSKLHSGDYTLGGKPGVSFQRLAFAGHSVSADQGAIIAATSPGIDAVIHMGWSDTEQNPFFFSNVAIFAACLSSPSGYANLLTPGDFQTAFEYDFDPVIAANFEPNLDPCGFAFSAFDQVGTAIALAPQLTVPILVLLGDHDAFFPATGATSQGALYTGSPDVKVKILKDIGHDYLLNLLAARVTNTLDDWLTKHGF